MDRRGKFWRGSYMLARQVTDGEQYGGVIPFMAKDSGDPANQW